MQTQTDLQPQQIARQRHGQNSFVIDINGNGTVVKFQDVIFCSRRGEVSQL
ncbi:hypothetical protein KK083_17400 [Fulvivirgaceae bacterium PWU4]|uniref:Uncharacterized protein n=1 Tax=Chryseosolibacter histidini TaxID=2782349 RepID=A0AAP2DLP6_9BACT|nr:hypothetical protein [Chryseosolibacter histidini]MBT1698673.1 hypothetical protein [Chryseosolibacter histidini]